MIPTALKLVRAGATSEETEHCGPRGVGGCWKAGQGTVTKPLAVTVPLTVRLPELSSVPMVTP
jgi:hypothetical protein